jgi:hypothetical protein
MCIWIGRIYGKGWNKGRYKPAFPRYSGLQLFALAYNLANFLRSLALPREVAHWSLTTLREKLVKIGARTVRTAAISCSSWPRWRCRVPCSPASCAGSTACEGRPWRRPDWSEPWGGRSRGGESCAEDRQ